MSISLKEKISLFFTDANVIIWLAQKHRGASLAWHSKPKVDIILNDEILQGFPLMIEISNNNI